MKAAGIDIGTSSICAVLIDGETGELLRSKTVENTSRISSSTPWERLQEPDVILGICRQLLAGITEDCDEVMFIGVTGQMHGILYIDALGRAVSPLYTWQDERGNQLYKDKLSYSDYLSENGGCAAPSGFGLATHFYNQINELIDKTALTFCSIADYVAMSLKGEKNPLLHQSMAASFGFFNLSRNDFDMAALKAAGVNTKYLPPVCENEKCYQMKSEKPFISAALGDNQASFLGSVGEGGSALINVGTGSQISVLSDVPKMLEVGECRPFVDGKYLLVGSSLCGGYAYELLRDFFCKTAQLVGIVSYSGDEIYEAMNAAAEQAYRGSAQPLHFDTRFKGTRLEPRVRGKIEGIDYENFTPGYFALGALEGICEELYEMYLHFSSSGSKMGQIVGSGNGIRRNPLLSELFSKRFEAPLTIPMYSEEAAYGSALFSLYSSGFYADLNELRSKIKYLMPL